MIRRFSFLWADALFFVNSITIHIIGRLRPCLICKVALIGLLWCSNGNAMQLMEMEENGETSAFIAADELSRIKVIDDRIRSVRSNEGIVEVVEDNVLGEIYIRPIKSDSQPINMFIATEKQRVYKLLLLPKKMPSEQIFIKGKEVAEDIKTHHKAEINREAILNLISAMEAGTGMEGYVKESLNINRRINDHELIRKLAYFGEYYKGEIYEYTTEEEIKITPEKFYEKGVVAISVDKEQLNPGETTRIYIIREVEDGRA